MLRGAAGLALLFSVAVAGYEAAGPDVALALPAAILHLASMAVWLGGLVVLGLAVLPALRRGMVAEAGLRRWSITTYSCVICLVVTGEYQASRQVSPVQALWSTWYGVLLLAKVALVAIMLAAASWPSGGSSAPLRRRCPAAGRFGRLDRKACWARIQARSNSAR